MAGRRAITLCPFSSVGSIEAIQRPAPLRPRRPPAAQVDAVMATLRPIMRFRCTEISPRRRSSPRLPVSPRPRPSTLPAERLTPLPAAWSFASTTAVVTREATHALVGCLRQLRTMLQRRESLVSVPGARPRQSASFDQTAPPWHHPRLRGTTAPFDIACAPRRLLAALCIA